MYISWSLRNTLSFQTPERTCCQGAQLYGKDVVNDWAGRNYLQLSFGEIELKVGFKVAQQSFDHPVGMEGRVGCYQHSSARKRHVSE